MRRILQRVALGSLFLVAVLVPALHAKDDVCGRLESAGEHRILWVWGNPEERGEAEGYLLADAIYETFVGFQLSSRLLPNPMLWDGMVIPTVQQRMNFSEATRQRAEGTIRGMRRRRGAEGMQVQKLGRELKGTDLLAAVAAVDLVGGFCSSFVAAGELLESGEGPLVGRNLDYAGTDEQMKHAIVRVEAKRPGRRGWVGLTYPGFLGCLTGFSDAGISLAIHDVPARMPGKGQVTPRPEVLLQLMETLVAGTEVSEEALLQARKYRYGFGGNFMLGWSAKGSAGGAVLEVDPQASSSAGVSLRGFGEFPYVICTNHHRERQTPTGCNRFASLNEGCELVAGMESEPLNFESAWELLSRATVKDTLYRSLVNLETGKLRFQPRHQHRGPLVTAFEGNVRELLERGSAPGR